VIATVCSLQVITRDSTRLTSVTDVNKQQQTKLFLFVDSGHLFSVLLFAAASRLKQGFPSNAAHATQWAQAT